ncbi:M23 family metallopeptidase [Lentimicrobium sp. S6]|uniref:M23 family metallopeptidase n=1 Tax=Lentimicrobium sp. S6 TaxID=2735872 RepID=UPI001554F6E6|nr:M23 family metallopeptidase [Lentimicrobium sp. S6]NPD44413.1 M23 family metallopeptidase [Lentimicrobium sp. S6]
MKFKYILLIFLSSVLFQHLNAQTKSKYPQDYFRSPVEGRIYLSGTFGELRSNHFHGGIDIKTGGVEGKNIYAAADGWVSRIKISPWGYGNAVYIDHPNGYTTVYGHLKELKGDAAKYVEQQQYKNQSFSVDLYVKAGQFPVKKGDIIALSGNTGGSGGPHLHFEIRETANQEIINPLLFGFKVKDFITPTISSIRIYPAEEQAKIEGKQNAQTFTLKGWGSDYLLKEKDTLEIAGDFYLGINTIDKQNDTQNKNGVYEIEIFVDSNLVYSHNVERLNFASTRYINTLIDFDFYKKKGRSYQRTYQSPNNKLPIYNKIVNKGVFSFNDNQYHQIKYIVKDIHDNKAILNFTVFSKTIENNESLSSGNLYYPLGENNYEDENIKVYFPSRSLYDTLSFSSSIEESDKSINGKKYHIGKVGAGLQEHIHVKLKNIEIEEDLKNNIYIGEYYKKSISAYSSSWENTYDLSFKTRDFGEYLILVDTIAPSIKVRTKLENNKTPKSLSFTITDQESGISDYNAWFNGSWILMSYDPKKSRLTCQLNNIQEKNVFKIIINDGVGNISEKILHF